MPLWASAKLLRPRGRVCILWVWAPQLPSHHHHNPTSILLQDRVHVYYLSLPAGNHGNNFRIHVSNGLLMRGPRPLDRERNSSHVLIVEAYNHDLGPMRSSVRVRPGALGPGVWVVGMRPGTALGEALRPVQR